MRTRFRERPASQSRGWLFMASVGLLGIAAVLVLAFVGFNAPNAIPGRSYYNIKAQFNEADNLTPHSQVRLNGRLVGQVLDPRIVDGKPVLDIQLEPDVKPLYSNATIEVRPRSAVGVRYVDLKKGKPGPGVAELGEGDMIPARNTSVTRTLDEVLSTFDEPTRNNTQFFLRELGTGFAGRGQDINDLLGDTPPMLQDTDDVLGTIADRKGAVQTLVRGAGTLAGTIDPVRETVRDGFRPEADALAPFGEERGAVQDVLETAPGAFSTLRGRLPAVQPLLAETAGFAREARPVLTAGPNAFGQTSALLKESRPGLRDAEDTLALADKAVNPTLKLLDTVRPVLPELDATMLNTQPVTDSLGAYGCDIVRMGRQWGSMMHLGNQDGGVLRFNVQFGPESVYGQTNRTFGNTPATPYPEPCTTGPEETK